MRNFWAEEEIEQLRELAAKGLSATLIAEKMKRTRNAVIGKCQRVGVQLLNAPPSYVVNGGKLSGRKPAQADLAVIRTAQQRRVEERRKRREAEERLQAACPKPATKARSGAFNAVMAVQASECRFPYGDPGSDDFRFCCAPTDAPSLPYCQAHMRKAYVPAQLSERLRRAKQKQERNNYSNPMQSLGIGGSW